MKVKMFVFVWLAIVCILPTSTLAASTYTVKKGDNLTKISKKTGVSIKNLLKLNNLKLKGIIKIGQTIALDDSSLLPSLAKPIATVLPATIQVAQQASQNIAQQQTATISQQQTQTSVIQNIVIPPEPAYNASEYQPLKFLDDKNTVLCYRRYVIDPGETVESTALKFSVDSAWIRKINSFTQSQQPKVGSILRVPLRTIKIDDLVLKSFSLYKLQKLQRSIDINSDFVSPLNVNDFASVSLEFGVPLELMIAQGILESRLGTYGPRPIATKNMMSVGNFDDGTNRYFDSWLDGVKAYAKLIKTGYATNPNNITIEDIISKKFQGKWGNYSANPDYTKIIAGIIGLIRNVNM